MRKMMRGVSFALIVAGAVNLLTPALPAKEFNWSLPDLGRSTSGKWELRELSSAKGAAESFKTIDKPEALGLAVSIKEEPIAAHAHAVRVTLRNDGQQTRFIKSSFAVTPALNDFQWWNGYANRIELKFDPEDTSLTQWFPANAALGEARGVSLGLDPLEVYSRVDSGLSSDGRQLLLDIPIVLNPGEERTTSFVVTSFPTRYSYRDVVQNYYDLFPQAYRPANVDPSVISSQSTYLFWRPQYYDMEHSDDMIRRFTGGYGGWEWCYAPFVRGGDWAMTYEWSEGFRKISRRRIDQRRKSIQESMGRADALDVAPMYYVNVLWAEKTLMEENFPEVLNNPISRRSWGNDAIVGLYPWANRYGDLFAESIRNIAEWYPQSRGMGWDSAFGHFRAGESVAGVLQTPWRSFDKGEQFVMVGVGYTPLLDLNRSFKSGPYDRANAVNLKLVSPYFLGVRSDTALYEGHPAQAPNRLMRFEVMRANLGSPKAISWHKDLVPSHLRWVKWDTLDAVQVRDAMRQIYQDVVFLSYFWGGIPSPGMPTLGVPFVFNEVPTLIELVKKGWQPAPAFEAAEGGQGLLFARYGQGAGAVVAVINPEFTAATTELSFPIDYWQGKNLLLTRRDNQPLRTQVTENGTVTRVEVPARSVLLLDVAALVDAESYSREPDVLTATPAAYSDGRTGWDFTLETFIIRKWNFEVAPPADGFIATALRIGRKVEVVPADKPLAFSLDSAAWPDDVQEMNRRTGNFSLTRQPLVALGVSAEQLGALSWFASAGGGTAVVFEGVSPQAQAQINQMLERWFLFYTANALKAAEKPQAGAEGKGVTLTFRLGADAAQGGQAGAPASVAAGGDNGAGIVLGAEDEAELIAATDALLGLMDKAFPYYGQLYRKDDTLEFAGLNGTVLEGQMESDFILKPTLGERWKQYFDDFNKQ